jgi:uncharacterized C2H2 Zn-finger protein
MHRYLIFLDLGSKKSMLKLILLSLRARKRIISTTQRFEQSLFKQNYRKQKNNESLAPHRSAPEKIRSIPHRPKTVEKLHHSPRRSLTRVDLRRKKHSYSKQTNKKHNYKKQQPKWKR